MLGEQLGFAKVELLESDVKIFCSRNVSIFGCEETGST